MVRSGSGHPRNKGEQGINHLTGNGIIRIRRRVWWYRGAGRDERLDRWLGIAESSVSVAGRELCCRVAMGSSFEKAVDNLARVGQVVIGKQWMRQIVEGEGQRVNALRTSGVVGPGWQASDCAVAPGGPTRVMTGSDGVKVPLITEAEKRRRRENQARRRAGRKARRSRRDGRRRVRGADQPYKEFKIGVFYDEPRTHQYAFGTSGDHTVLGKMLRREAAKLKLGEADEKLSISDGAEWIRRQFQTQLPMLDAMILDFYHLAEHVAGTARTCYGEGSQAAATWTHRVLEAVRNEGAGAVLVVIEETWRTVRSPRKRKGLQDLRTYVAKRCDMLDYPAFRARGFDIGSGPTEAFCKTLTARLKGSGMRWNRRNAEAVMALAALEHSHLWQTYWNAQRQAAA